MEERERPLTRILWTRQARARLKEIEEFYRVAGTSIEILTVFEGHRQLDQEELSRRSR